MKMKRLDLPRQFKRKYKYLYKTKQNKTKKELGHGHGAKIGRSNIEKKNRRTIVWRSFELFFTRIKIVMWILIHYIYNYMMMFVVVHPHFK